MGLSLRLKLTLAYVTLAVVCTFALGMVGLLLLQQANLNHVQDRLAAEVRLAGAMVSAMGPSGGELGQVTERVARLTGARVTIVDTAGTVQADSVLAPDTADNHADRPEIAAALAGQGGRAIRTSTSTGTATAYVAGPLTVDGQVVGAVRLALPIAEIESQVRSNIVAVGGLTVFGATITALLTLLVTRVLTQPLREVTLLVRQAATGQFGGRLPVRSRDELGQLAESYNQMADELDRMLRASARQQAELEAILDGVPDGLVIVDAEQRIRRTNHVALAIFNVEGEQPVGASLIDVSQDHDLVDVVDRSLRQHETARAIVERGQAPAALSVTATPIAAGSLTGALITLHDVSDLRRLEQGRRQFVANISHELRTPLSTIKLMVETLQEDPTDAPLVADFLRRINAEIDSLTQMVRELLELSQLESGQAPLQFERLDLAYLATQAVERLRPQAERGGISLAADESLATLPPLSGDSERLEGVLVNLVHNAIKFTPPGGAVTVGGHADAGVATIWVRDTGVGIAARDLPHIFERFYKADRARATGGTGLGLAIVKHTVQAHGGQVWAESIHGQGSTFLFTLPVSVPAELPVPSHAD